MGSTIYDDVNVTCHLDPAQGVYQERTGSPPSSLTPSTVGDPVGTWESVEGLVFRAPSDAKRPTLGQDSATGQKYIIFTNVDGTPQYFISDDAASTWTYLNNGTSYELAIGMYSLATTTEMLPLIATCNSAATQHGMTLIFDRRVPASNDTLRYIVLRAVAGTTTLTSATQPGIGNKRWLPAVCTVDPDNATPRDRIRILVNGRPFDDNEVGSSVDAIQPSYTLHIGGLGAETAETVYGSWYCSGVMIYSGTWTAAEKKTVNNWLDIGRAGYYSIDTAATNISGQVTVYEGFPRVVKTHDGNLLCMYRSGTSHAADKGTLTSAISSDAGATWTLTANAISHATLDTREAAMIVLRNGKVLVANSNYDYGAGTQINWQVSTSTDNGATFTTATPIEPAPGYDYQYPWGEWRELADGTILGFFYSKMALDDTIVSEILESTDEGKSWKPRGRIGSGMTEASFCKINSSTWLAIVRESGGSPNLWSSTSTDDCRTWSTLVDTGIDGGVTPDIRLVGNTVYVFFGDRWGTNAGISLYTWTNDYLHGSDETPVYLGSVTTDIGNPSAVVDGRTVYMVAYDETATPTAGTPGVFFMKFTLPDFGTENAETLKVHAYAYEGTVTTMTIDLSVRGVEIVDGATLTEISKGLFTFTTTEDLTKHDVYQVTIYSNGTAVIQDTYWSGQDTVGIQPPQVIPPTAIETINMLDTQSTQLKTISAETIPKANVGIVPG